MASSASRGGDRMIHQDYIARIRYSNTLPPPPNPPKLLDIPNTGLASGQYTNPGFASRLAREQPLNIEADAELGMPIDLVGLPGIFDGDESSIQAPLHAPVPHPHDRSLLRPLAALGKPKTNADGVSFLRRTEYISSYTGKSRFDSTTSRSLIHSTGHTKVTKLPSNVDKESPVYIKAQVERNFQIAAEKLAEPRRLVHPTKPHLKLLSTFPLIPDLAAFPDFGGYISVKFQHNPVPPSNVYDTRLESSLLRLIPLPQERADARDAAVALAEADPEHYSFPEPDQNFEFYLLDTPEESKKYKRKCDVLDSERDDDDLYTYEGTLKDQPHKSFRFNRVREYETASSIAPEQGDKYGDEVAIALNDGKDRKHQRAAYYYPIVQRQQIRPQRRKNMEAKFSGLTKEEEETMVDIVDLVVEEPTEVEATRRQAWVDDPEYGPEEDAEETLPADTQPSAGQEARESEVDVDDDESEG